MFILHNMDCLKFMKSLPDKVFDVSFTSPPYNRKRNDKYQNYSAQVEDYFGWMCNVLDELLRLTKLRETLNLLKKKY